MIQDHIPPPPKVSPPHSPTELERAQQLAKLLEEKARLEKKIQGEEEQVSKAKDQATFKRNYGPYGGDDVSSLEGDKPQVGVHGQDMTETPYL